MVVWAHGATGIVPGCAPSLGPDPSGIGSIPDVAAALVESQDGLRAAIEALSPVANAVHTT